MEAKENSFFLVTFISLKWFKLTRYCWKDTSKRFLIEAPFSNNKTDFAGTSHRGDEDFRSPKCMEINLNTGHINVIST